MKVTLYMAISIDGKTTAGTDDVSWVETSDIDRMDTCMEQCGVMVMGRGTYESFGDDLPTEKAWQVVVTNQQVLLTQSSKNVTFTNQSPEEVLKMIEDKGFSEVLLAGGEELNTTFLNKKLIDEIRLIVKPIVIGQGKSLFKQLDGLHRFELVGLTKLENGSTEMKYKARTT